RDVLRAVDALHAHGALLHDALGAHHDVGVQRPVLGLGHVPVVGPVVEAAGLVRAVVGAEPRADAPVLHHDVQPFLAVVGREGGADRLTRRGAAVLAHERRVPHVDFAVVGHFDVALDAEPVHLAADPDVVGSDDRDVVLGDARGHAGVAARA